MILPQQMQFTVFDKKTGQVLRSGSSSLMDLVANANAPDDIVMGGWYDPAVHYLDLETNQVKEKAIFAGFVETLVAAGDVFLAHNIPIGTMVKVDGDDPVKIDDGTLEIEPQHPGPFAVKIWGPRIREWEGIVDAY